MLLRLTLISVFMILLTLPALAEDCVYVSTGSGHFPRSMFGPRALDFAADATYETTPVRYDIRVGGTGRHSPERIRARPADGRAFDWPGARVSARSHRSSSPAAFQAPRRGSHLWIS